jgi:hypothetical protein
MAKASTKVGAVKLPEVIECAAELHCRAFCPEIETIEQVGS